MHNLRLIITREYLSRVKNKSFVVMTFLSPLILVGMIVLIAYLAMLNQEGVKTIAVYDESNLFKEIFEDTEEVNFTHLSEISLDDARKIVKEKDYYGLLYIPESIKSLKAEGISFFSKESPGFSLIENLERKISQKLTNIKLTSSGIDMEKLKSAETMVVLDIQDFSGVHTSKISSYVKMFFGGAAGYLLMMFIIIYGNMVMRSVIEEKTNRIVEIIISSVKPVQLMLGKILGTSFAGITQFLIWVFLGGILMVAASVIFGIDFMSVQTPQKQALEAAAAQTNMQQLVMEIADLPLLSLIINFLIYFVGGYFLYSSIYAAIGAAVDSETDTQQFMFPIILPLMLGIYVGFFAVIENPHGSVSTIFSMIPLTSPIVMLMRIPFGVPLWELLLSIAILFLTIAGVIWFASKIYKIGILMYGKKPSYKDLYKWLKY